eukprot:TRINITY_DN26102_c0_g1_i6.p8 TRINITY_DN26102_c0_g1~~TRINITY_DN26102_c0_g1_i6.p8  ORF type:complete len:101 (+),score=7.01 TRINITY_DN26102_c0_g1_i6:1163-1465(+)
MNQISKLVLVMASTDQKLIWRGFSAIAGESWVLTSEGPQQVKDLEQTPCDLLVEGQKVHVQGFQSVGQIPMVMLDSYRGQAITCSDDVQLMVFNSKKKLD